MSPSTQEHLTIGALAQAAGVNVETIRYYQRIGLMPEPPRPPGGVRRYGEHEHARLRFIRTAQRLGFTLEEIATLLKLQDGTRCAEASEIADHKLADVRLRIADLRRIEGALKELVGRCRARRGNISCPLIEALIET